MHVCGDAQTLQQAGGVGFGLPAAQLRKLCLQVGSPQAVRIGEILLFVDGVLLLHHIVQVLVAHDDGVHDGILIVGVLVLLQHGNPLVCLHHHSAGGGIQLAGEDAKEGGFACAVGADDAVAVAGQKLQVNMLEQPLAAKLHAEIRNCDHILTPYPSARRRITIQFNNTTKC